MSLLQPLARCHASHSSLLLERLALQPPPWAPRPLLRALDVTRAKWGPSSDVPAVGQGCYEDLQHLAFFPAACCSPFSPATWCDDVRGCVRALFCVFFSFVGHVTASLHSGCWSRLPCRLVVGVTFCFVLLSLEICGLSGWILCCKSQTYFGKDAIVVDSFKYISIWMCVKCAIISKHRELGRILFKENIHFLLTLHYLMI